MIVLHRSAWVSLVSLFLIVAGCGGPSPVPLKEARTVRVGYQRGSVLNGLRLRGTLERALKSLNASVEWVNFPSGSTLLDGLDRAKIDLGVTADAPPILAQAAGKSLIYVAYGPHEPRSEAILVAANSPMQKIADLRGRKVALERGSTSHYFLVCALEDANLVYRDVEPVFLEPAEALAALAAGRVDAWVTWDPHYAEAEVAKSTRMLADGFGLVGNREMLLASKAMVRDHRDLIASILKAAESEVQWATSNRGMLAQILADDLKIDFVSAKRVTERRVFDGMSVMSPAVVAEQQRIADTFTSLGVIPHPISVGDAALPAGSIMLERAPGP